MRERAYLHFLGTGAALSDPHRTTTMLAFTAGESALLVDAGGDLVQRMLAAGIPTEYLRALVLTHEHPDHVSGFPLFMEKMWLAGRAEPIDLYGIKPALEQAARTLASFDTSGWEGFPVTREHEVAPVQGATVYEDGDWLVTAAPGDHGVPVIALRVEHRKTGRSVAYSCDTARSQEIVHLARGADILVHEATGAFPGHSTAMDAAAVAAEAGVRRLYLVHLPPESELGENDMSRARAVFPRTEKAGELSRLEI